MNLIMSWGHNHVPQWESKTKKLLCKSWNDSRTLQFANDHLHSTHGITAAVFRVNSLRTTTTANNIFVFPHNIALTYHRPTCSTAAYVLSQRHSDSTAMGCAAILHWHVVHNRLRSPIVSLRLFILFVRCFQYREMRCALCDNWNSTESTLRNSHLRISFRLNDMYFFYYIILLSVYESTLSISVCVSL